ncbi:MAG: hypothetical protein IJ684_05470 [Bacteroidales bacterium]|nr:hypothetical protein [Bacteroidales bacterium]
MRTSKLLLLTATLTMAASTLHAQKWGSTPEDSVDCVMNQSIYSEFYKSKDYASAYDPWKAVMAKCPSSSKNLYIRGVNIMNAKINSATSEAEREAFIAELMAMYDSRIIHFGEASDVTGKKAQHLEQLRGAKGVKDYYPIYAECMRLGGDNVSAEHAYKFFQATVLYVISGYADTTLIVDNYDIVSSILDKAHRIEKDTTKAKYYAGYLANVEAVFSPFASCEELVKIYSKKFANEPENVELLKKITNILSRKRCTNEELFFQASEKLHSLEPSASTALMMGKMCYNKGRYSEAVKYINEAIAGIDDPRDKYDAYIVLGAAHTNNRNFSAARSAYRLAAEVEPGNGEPYRMIAQLYASSTGTIDDGMGGLSAYWAAVDKAVHARNIDSSTENVEAANKLISAYSARFPKQDKAFMLDLIDGHSFTVPGWIGESTIIRTRK